MNSMLFLKVVIGINTKMYEIHFFMKVTNLPGKYSILFLDTFRPISYQPSMELMLKLPSVFVKLDLQIYQVLYVFQSVLVTLFRMLDGMEREFISQLHVYMVPFFALFAMFKLF